MYITSSTAIYKVCAPDNLYKEAAEKGEQHFEFHW